jgi:three-Cys-motif partner protein
VEEIDPYAGREQALVKHTVLRSYLQVLAFKLAQSSRSSLTLNYVDGFSGPWRRSAEDSSDTSPHIALSVMKDVQEKMRGAGRSVRARCLFVERDSTAHEELVSLLSRFPEVEAQALHGTFEDSLPTAVDFLRVGSDPFGFVFIDPTGWTGFGLQRLKTLFVKRSEVLVNFMTKDITRFLDHPESAPSLTELFDGDAWRDCARHAGMERADCLASRYAAAVERVLGFRHAGYALVLHPEHERLHYHLVYATNSLAGLLAFREVERKAMTIQGEVRGSAQLRRRMDENPDQRLLLGSGSWKSTSLEKLAASFRLRAREAVERLLQPSAMVPYDTIVAAAARFPMTSKAEVNEWLTAWRASGRIRFEGLVGRAKLPAMGKGHQVVVLVDRAAS